MKIKNLKIIALFGSIGLSVLTFQIAKAWTEPTVAPPNGNVSAPINNGAVAQSKAGLFSAWFLGSGTSIIAGNPYSSPTSNYKFLKGDVAGQRLCIGEDCRGAWPAGDNLGNHTATQNLNLNGKDLTNARQIYTDGIYLGGTNLDVVGGVAGTPLGNCCWSDVCSGDPGPVVPNYTEGNCQADGGYDWVFTHAGSSGNNAIDFADGAGLALKAGSLTNTNISQFANDSGYITDGNTNWDNSYGFITAADIPAAVAGIGGAGTGTANKIAKWTANNAIGDSSITDNGTNIGIGTSTNLFGKLNVGDATGSGWTAASNVGMLSVLNVANGNVAIVGHTWKTNGVGVYGVGEAGTGVYGRSTSDSGVYGIGGNYGVRGYSSGTGALDAVGVYGVGNDLGRGTGVKAWGSVYDFYASNSIGKSYFAGSVGIRTTTTSSPLTVAGTIESTSGGVKFPDGTTQTTAAVGWQRAFSAGGCGAAKCTVGAFTVLGGHEYMLVENTGSNENKYYCNVINTSNGFMFCSYLFDSNFKTKREVRINGSGVAGGPSLGSIYSVSLNDAANPVYGTFASSATYVLYQRLLP